MDRWPFVNLDETLGLPKFLVSEAKAFTAESIAAACMVLSGPGLVFFTLFGTLQAYFPMQRMYPWLTAVLAIGCLILGYMAIQERMDGRIAAKEAQKQVEGLQQQLTAAKAAQALAAKKALQTARSSTVSPESPGGNPNGGRKIIQVSDIIKDHPEFAALYAKQVRRNLDRLYGGGLNTLNLPPDQLSRLKDLLAERQMSVVDAAQATAAAGLKPGSPEWLDAMKQASTTNESQITGILGDNADMTLAQLQARGAMQNQVSNLSSEFTDAGVALTPDQSSGLVKAMLDAFYWAGKDMSDRPANYNEADPTTGLSIHDDRILNNASQVLSAAQLQVLKANQLESEQLSTLMRQYGPGPFPPFMR